MHVFVGVKTIVKEDVQFPKFRYQLRKLNSGVPQPQVPPFERRGVDEPSRRIHLREAGLQIFRRGPSSGQIETY